MAFVVKPCLFLALLCLSLYFIREPAIRPFAYCASQLKKCRSRNLIVALVLAAALTVSAVAVAKNKTGSDDSPDNEEPPFSEPDMTPPAKNLSDAYPQVYDSLLLFFSMERYADLETKADDVTKLSKAIASLMKTRFDNQRPFMLPQGFQLHDAVPTAAVNTVETCEEYDGQLLDAWQNTQDLDDRDDYYQYQRIATAALNCLNLLQQDYKDDKYSSQDAIFEDFLYYAELAVWGLSNQAVLAKLFPAQKVDLYYRLGQAFDHAGTAAKDSAPPFQHELYFVSAAFLELALNELESLGFQSEGHEYCSAVWDLYMTMHDRMGRYSYHHSGFFAKVDDCANRVLQLALDEDEQAKVTNHQTEIETWAREHAAIGCPSPEHKEGGSNES